jgi:hypothetical protein
LDRDLFRMTQAIVQASDPGAVGSGAFWLTPSGILSIRNKTNTGWTVICLAPCTDPCGITDTFTRTVASGWGTSDSTLVWTNSGVTSVNGTQGVLAVNTWADLAALIVAPNLDMTFDFICSAIGAGVYIEVFTSDNSNELCDFYISDSIYPNNIQVVRSPDTIFGSSDFGGFVLAGTVVNHCRIQVDNAGGRIKLWTGGTEPGPWTVDSTTVAPTPFDGGPVELFVRYSIGDGGTHFYMDNLNITGVNSCTH